IFEGQEPPPPVTLLFRPLEFLTRPIGTATPTTARVESGAREFVMPSLFGTARLLVSVPSPWIVSRVTRSGVDVTDAAFDFRQGDVDGLEVVLTDQSGAISGSVTSGADPAASCLVV